MAAGAAGMPEVRSVVVVGLGRSGSAAVELLTDRCDAKVTAVDDKPAAQLSGVDELRAAGVELVLGDAAALPDDAELVVRSPGVPDDHAVLRSARDRGLPVWSEVELAFRFLDNPVVGITGTNGKTTTTELTGAMVRAANLPCAVAGNVGNALARLPRDVESGAIVVVELSSFQLQDIEAFRADVGVLLNITEDHLDRHGSMAAYTAAKLRLFENQDAACVAVLDRDDRRVRQAAVPGTGLRVWYSCRAAARESLHAGVDGGVLWLDESLFGAATPARVASRSGRRIALCPVAELALKGEHNLGNALAAAAAAAAIGVPLAAIQTTLRTFPGIKHRLQVVGTVAGVTYVNDSKATNVDAAVKALTAYHGRVQLILGGSLKGAAFDELVRATEGRVERVLLIGEAAGQLRDAFDQRAAHAPGTATPYVVVGDLQTAVREASRRATAGSVVLLSPACASFDQYRNYEERGEHFIELVEELRRHEMDAPS